MQNRRLCSIDKSAASNKTVEGTHTVYEKNRNRTTMVIDSFFQPVEVACSVNIQCKFINCYQLEMTGYTLTI